MRRSRLSWPARRCSCSAVRGDGEAPVSRHRSRQDESGARAAPVGGRARRAALFAAIPLIAGAVFAGALQAGFVWDDWFLVAENPRLRSFDHLSSLFAEDYVFVPETNLAYGYYRPLSSLSFVADAAIWGLEPRGFHLTNLLLHALASLSVALLAVRLGLGRGAAFACGLLFAVHPIHTESVAWISGRTDLLAFVLAAASFHAHLAAGDLARGGRRARWLRAASVLLFALALLAKEMAAVLPLWLLCWEVRRGGPGTSQRDSPGAWRVALPHFAVLVLYLVIRFGLIDLPAPGQPAGHSAGLALATAAPTVVRYLARLAWPADLSAYLRNPYVHGFLDPRNLGALAFLALLAWGVLALARRRPEAARLGAMLAFSFLPILNLPRIAGPADMGAPMADRFAYFPSFPFLALVALAVETVVAASRRPRRAALVAASALLALAAFAGGASARETAAWRDDETLFSRETTRTPDAPLLWTQLARARLRSGDLDGAGRALARAEATDPEGNLALAVRAEWHVRRGEAELALPLQRRAVGERGRSSPAARNNLAYLYRRTGQEERALPILEALTRELPDYADPYLNLGEARWSLGDLDGAIESLERYVALRPQDLEGLDRLARALGAAGRFEAGERIYLAAIGRSPGEPRLWNNLALLRADAGDLEGARDALEHALALSSATPRARFNLAVVLRDLGREEDARARFAELAAAHPDSPEGEAARRELESAAPVGAGRARPSSLEEDPSP